MEEGMDRPIHPCILKGTTRLATVGSDKSQWRMSIEHGDMDRQSLHYLVDFLEQTRARAHPVTVTELVLDSVLICLPFDGGLDVLRDFLANDATLTKVGLVGCDLAGTAGITRLLGFLQTNTTVKELQLSDCKITDEELSFLADALDGNTTLEILDLRDNFNFTAIGVSHIIRIMATTRLKKIKFGGNGAVFHTQGIAKRFAHALRENKFLKSLEINVRSLPGPVAAMMFRALEFNTTLEELLLGRLIHFTEPQCVVDQLIESIPRMTGIKRLSLGDWDFCMHHAAFLPALNKNASIQDLPGINQWPLPGHRERVATINNVLARNRSLSQVDFLLATQPRLGFELIRTVECGTRPL